MIIIYLYVVYLSTNMYNMMRVCCAVYSFKANKIYDLKYKGKLNQLVCVLSVCVYRTVV